MNIVKKFTQFWKWYFTPLAIEPLEAFQERSVRIIFLLATIQLSLNTIAPPPGGLPRYISGPLCLVALLGIFLTLRGYIALSRWIAISATLFTTFVPTVQYGITASLSIAVFTVNLFFIGVFLIERRYLLFLFIVFLAGPVVLGYKSPDFSAILPVYIQATLLSAGLIWFIRSTMDGVVGDLQETVSHLEERVSERTRDLEIATQVSKQITQELRLEELLPKLVESVKEGFGLYFVSVYLFEENDRLLSLSAGTGDAGVQMKEEGKVYRLEARPSIVAQAGREKQAVVIGDVAQSNLYSPNRFLPDTHSEAALPMIVQGELVGVLGVQSVEVDGFDRENLGILTSLAEQIGVAVRNAQLYEEQIHVSEELKRVDEMKSQFLSSMSHELRTPLNAIINFVDMVATGLIGPINKEQEDLLKQSLNSSRHLLYLINDVLDISKIQAGKLTLYVEQGVDLEQEIDGVVAMVSGMQKERPNVEFVLDIDRDLPKISCDRRRVRQVLLNLLTNAFKFTPKGSVTLSAKNMGEAVQFAVLDTGPGISEELQERIFEPFEQTVDGVKQVEGTGLGLPISRSLVEAHGGKLWVESTPGEGSAFYFLLKLM